MAIHMGYECICEICMYANNFEVLKLFKVKREETN